MAEQRGCVLHVGATGLRSSSREVVLAGQDAAERLAKGGFAVVVLHPNPSCQIEALGRQLQDIDPLATVLVLGQQGNRGGVIGVGDLDCDQAVAWGRSRHVARVDALVRQQGGSPAGEFACRGRDELIGGGEAMSGFRSRLRQVAEHDVSTLIHGSCGTPLEPAARWLHVSSGRREHPFVLVDCRADPEPQLLVRIFGHVSNAFPGAIEPTAAAVALAAGGTLVLDGIEHASRRVQMRVVELLRDRAWRPIGTETTNTSHARVVIMLRQAPLQALVGGDLQRDLMEQVSGHVVRMPTLADRAEDIPDLVRHHVTQSSIRLGRPQPQIDAATLGLLADGRWAGHDRELELVCERMVLHAISGRVDPDVVATWVVAGPCEPGEGSLVCDSGRTLADLERTAILATLAHHKGHRRRSAAALGIGVRTLGLKLRRWKDASIVPETI
jgi:DNA-binding NtrC family response regulator